MSSNTAGAATASGDGRNVLRVSEAVIRIAGGRQQLGQDQYRCFMAGANGAMVGNYLTTTGNSIEEDLRNFTVMGFSFA